MHITSSKATQSAKGVVEGVANEDGIEVIFCPPYPYLALGD
jgi:hypothetical protein